MERVDNDYLPTTSYVILGLLTFREMSGYDLKQLINRSITHFYWSPAKSQIYGELRRLEAHGLVTMREVPQTLRPDKRLYKITPKGNEAVMKWLAHSGVDLDSYKSALMLKVFFGHMLSLDVLIGLLEERRKQVERDLVACQKKAEELKAKLERPDATDDLLFSLLTVQRSIRLHQTDIGWIDETLADLRQRQAQASAKRKRRAPASSARGRSR
ncbi:MAG: PadR family transcriptional regulator [candidate division KSB1 bacterium]|nr:PadR family transcriptional regulator [candidate division KSB1 bacterium]